MNRLNRVVVGVGIALLWSSQAGALVMDDGFFVESTLVDFESGFHLGGFASHQVDGAAFWSSSGSATLGVLNLGLGSFLMEITGSIRIDFTTEAVRVGFDYFAGSPIYLEAYDGGGTLLNPGDTGGLTGMGFLGFESTSAPIASVIIHDTGLTFMVDNLRFDAPLSASLVPVPEPRAALLFSVGLLTAVTAIRRKSQSS